MNHIEAWLSIVRRRAGGALLDEISADTDWPPPSRLSEESWYTARERLRSSYLELGSFIGQLTDADLDRELQGKLRTYSVYQDIHGVIQHSLYHLGQVVLLAQAVAMSSKT